VMTKGGVSTRLQHERPGACGRLGFLHDPHRGAVGDPRLSDLERSVLEINGSPRETEKLRASQSARRRQTPERGEAVILGVIQEGSHLFGGPRGLAVSASSSLVPLRRVPGST
jgi:hypothetical protein